MIVDIFDNLSSHQVLACVCSPALIALILQGPGVWGNQLVGEIISMHNRGEIWKLGCHTFKSPQEFMSI